jgi:hypothetical protein
MSTTTSVKPPTSAILAKAAIGAFRSRFRFVDNQVATLKLTIMQLLNGCLSCFRRAHLDESKSTRTACGSIRDNLA